MALVSDSIAALKAHMDAAMAGEDDLQTYVGNPAGQGDLPSAYAAVAYGGDDRPGVVGARDNRLGYGNDTVGDRWLVWCTISVATGDYLPAALLERVESLMDMFVDRIEDDIHLGGLLKADGRAELAAHEWVVEDAGNVCTVFFQIDVTRRW